MTVLSPDPLGYKDSSNLYSFAGGDPVNHRDPTGECWDLTDPKCRQELSDTASEFGRLTVTDQHAADRNAEHIVGGIESVGRGAKEYASFVVDTLPGINPVDPLGSVRRNVERVKSLATFVAHPLEANQKAADAILEHEERGEFADAGGIAADIGQTDAAAVIGAAQLGVAATRALRIGVTKFAVESIGNRVYENSLRVEAGKMIEDGRSIRGENFNRDLGREAGIRSQRVLERWARTQTGDFASANWAFGDIGPQLRMFPPANPMVNPLVANPRAFVIPDVYYRPLNFGIDFKLTNYANPAQDLGYATYVPLSDIRKLTFNPWAYPR